MGNSQGHSTGHQAISTRGSPLHNYHHQSRGEDQWTSSYPRGVVGQAVVPTSYQHKLVLPDRDAHQRLRPTGNGEILQAGGTISGRRHEWAGVSRSSSIPAVRQGPPRPTSQGQYPPGQKTRIPHRLNQPRMLTPSYRKMKRFGSEPDLRAPSSQSSQTSPEYQGYRGKKKYKAPAPPLNSLSSIDRNDFDEGLDAHSPIRRARLFKTRAETKKKISSPVNNRKNHPGSFQAPPDVGSLANQKRYKSSETLFESSQKSPLQKIEEREVVTAMKPPIPHMQRTRSSPEFQAELKQVTKKLGNLRRESQNQIPDKLKTLDHNISRKDILKNKLKELKALETLKDKEDVKETKGVLMELEDRSPASGKESTPELSPPKVKTFYFGMDDEQKIPNSIGSDMTSESDTELGSSHDISLQLRPILPKKQLEIPRFSPSAAWKLLSVDTAIDSTLASEEGSVYLEDRIEKHPRQQAPFRVNPVPSTHDKSGDSGISGDETPETMGPVSPKQRGMSWTPQQDLGDDSSLDGSNVDLDVKFPTRPHVFSLSLPRDNQLASYVANDKNFLQPYTSLQKLKRSVSGVLANLGKLEEDLDPGDQGENWFLSRSAPNSLNNGFNSLETRRVYKEEYDGPKQTRRIMYLPHSNLAPEKVPKKKILSKSYENISTLTCIPRERERPKPQNLQDPPNEETPKWTKKPKKFTFQSTVRQIERKRLADKLSKEAERKEKQRLRELEAMQRVEEEFQKKRAREKASIRQQLRLYSLEDTAWSSLPPSLDVNNEVRPEPDGAVSSSSPSPTFKKADKPENKAPGTQVLSEFRQSHREYREFRSGNNHGAMVHPRVTCNMPKATDGYLNDICVSQNYRQDFALGHGNRSSERDWQINVNSNIYLIN